MTGPAGMVPVSVGTFVESTSLPAWPRGTFDVAVLRLFTSVRGESASEVEVEDFGGAIDEADDELPEPPEPEEVDVAGAIAWVKTVVKSEEIC